MCRSWCETILGVIVIVFALMPQEWAKWVVVAVAAILIIHSFTCKACFHGGMHGGMGGKKAKYYSKKGKKG